MSSQLKKIGLPLLIIIGAIVAMMVMISMKQPPEKKPIEVRALLVDAKPINFESVSFKVEAQGNVVPKNQTNLTAQVSGRVVTIADVFVEGGFFNKGDVLVTLESDDFETEVQLAEAELARAQASLEEEIARGKVAETEFRSLNNTAPPELGLRKPQLAREKANVKAAEAQYQRALRNLRRTEVKAPYDGIVVSRNADIGQFVTTAVNLGEIYATDVAEVRLPLTDSDLAFVSIDKQTKLPVTLSATVAGRQVNWQGSVVRNEGVLDQRNRVVYVVVEVNDPYLRNGDRLGEPLRFGQFVNAMITGNQAENLVVLPRHTLRLDGSVLAVTPQKEIAIRQVDVMRADEDYVYISSGLERNDLVALSAVPNPYNGMPVRFLDDTSDVAPDESSDQEDPTLVKSGDNL
jgi:RND family efflux transporter MFP subunit